jgi:hypothetical protein
MKSPSRPFSFRASADETQNATFVNNSQSSPPARMSEGSHSAIARSNANPARARQQNQLQMFPPNPDVFQAVNFTSSIWSVGVFLKITKVLDIKRFGPWKLRVGMGGPEGN